MPTSSITKDFFVKDPEAYMKLLQEIEGEAKGDKQEESHENDRVLSFNEEERMGFH